jgi:hypothetical protein
MAQNILPSFSLVLYGFSLESSSFFMASNILPFFLTFVVKNILPIFRASRCTREINFLTLLSKTSFALHDLVLYGFSLELFFFYGTEYFALFQS